MRRLVRPALPLLDAEAAVERVDGRRFQRLVIVHRRQQAGKAHGEHRLAGAGRADHEQAVAAGRGDFQRALDLGLPLHVRQVGVVGCRRRGLFGVCREGLLAVEVGAHLQQ